ncbi:uncharacterized protein DSM5745_09567 [Aspergillus mulundensis]|uniref:Uncharacterized protein n=1 Tax=Aspergillus mulundensis TaxID=1810919 RepID=A0A3D8QVU8_9EURO|nr:hypothetical protein DSM5745_09567 [Aspergillus mulundensis]RDW65828.1 hypothetical protein DSM5745_09567 [Aspergillus mulundensis]
MSRKRLEQLLNVLQVATIPLNADKILYDSYGSSYTARSKVVLLMKPRDGRKTELLHVYVAETENAHITGRHEIILARSWREKFPVDDQDGRRTSAAPTELLKGNSRKERKEWEKNAAQKEKDNLAEAAKREAAWEKRMKEQQGKGKGPSSGK